MTKFIIVLVVLGVCQTSFATTDAELAEQVCKDALASAQVVEKTEKQAFFTQCMEQLTPQLKDQEAIEAPLLEPQDKKRY